MLNSVMKYLLNIQKKINIEKTTFYIYIVLNTNVSRQISLLIT
jgi:hypothetical protein